VTRRTKIAYVAVRQQDRLTFGNFLRHRFQRDGRVPFIARTGFGRQYEWPSRLQLNRTALDCADADLGPWRSIRIATGFPNSFRTFFSL
jgi:hypothetical protein